MLIVGGFTDDEGNMLVDDGDFGEKTKQALIKFQKMMKITVDGLAGSETWRSLGLTMNPYTDTPSRWMDRLYQLFSDDSNWKDAYAIYGREISENGGGTSGSWADNGNVSTGFKNNTWLSFDAPTELYNAGDIIYSNAVQKQLIKLTNDYYSSSDAKFKEATLLFLKNIRAAYNKGGYLNWEDSWYKAVEENQDGIIFALMAIDPAMGGAAEFRGLVATGEEVKGATGVVKWVGSLTGAVKEIDAAEMLVVDEWLAQGRNVVKIAKDPNAAVKTYDFIVDGVKIEAKALKNPNINTGITRIQDAFAQGCETAVIDGRKAGLTVEQAQQILNRTAGTYTNKVLPGNVEIWTNDGIVFTK